MVKGRRIRKIYNEYTKMSSSPEPESPSYQAPPQPTNKPFFDVSTNKKYIRKRFENDEWAGLSVKVLFTFKTIHSTFYVCEILYHGKTITVHLREEEISDSIENISEPAGDTQMEEPVPQMPKPKYTVTGLQPTYRFQSLRNRHIGFLSKYIQKTKRKN